VGFQTAAEQVGLLFVFMLLGLWAAKRHWISDDAVGGMTNILLNFVVPCTIVMAFQRPYTAGELRELGIVAVFDFLSFPIVIAVSYLVFRQLKDRDKQRALRFGATYSNSMFMGFPLVQALLGPNGLFFTIIFSLAFNVFVWSQGYSMFPSETTKVLKRVFSSAAIWAIIVGLALFLMRVQLPGILGEGLSYLGDMTAPLSMIIVGAGLAKVQWLVLLRDRWLWLGVAVRNLLVPLIAILLLWVLPVSATARMATLIPMACPVAAFLVLFSVKSDVDTTFPSSLVALSTVASIVSVPAILALASAIW